VPAGGAVLTWAHLLAAALWAGMLLYVVRAALAWRADPAAVHGLIHAYARVAAWLFTLVVATGVTEALLLVPLPDLFTTWYGRVLVIKAAVVAVAAGLALAGRLWLRRRPAAGAGPARVTRLESVTLVAVLAAAATLTTFAAPTLATSGGSLPFAPAGQRPGGAPGRHGRRSQRLRRRQRRAARADPVRSRRERGCRAPVHRLGHAHCPGRGGAGGPGARLRPGLLRHPPPGGRAATTC